MDISSIEFPPFLKNPAETVLELKFTLERIKIHKNRVLIDNSGTTGGMIDQNPTNRKKEILDIDGHTFRCIGVGFFADQNGVYAMGRNKQNYIYFTRIRANVDVDSFKSISEYYAKDKNRYYHTPSGKVIKETNCTLFDRDEWFAERSWWGHQSHQWEPIDEAIHFRAWISGILLGEKNVYANGTAIKGADPKTFVRKQQFYYADDKTLFQRLNGRTIKPMIGVDVNSLIFTRVGFPVVTGTDYEKPLYRHAMNEDIQAEDFARFAEFFEENRDTLSDQYWYYKLQG